MTKKLACKKKRLRIACTLPKRSKMNETRNTYMGAGAEYVTNRINGNIAGTDNQNGNDDHYHYSYDYC